MQNIFYNLSFDHWVIKFLSIIFLIVVINLSTRVILSYLKKQSSKTYNMWDDCVIDSIYKPFTFLVWIMGIIYALEFLNNDIEFITISCVYMQTKNKTLVISFSGGRTSGFLTKKLLEQKNKWKDILVIFANTGQEHEKTLEFIHNCDQRFNFNTIWLEAVAHRGEKKGSTAKIVNFQTCLRFSSFLSWEL